MCIVAGIGVFLYLVHMDVNYNAEGGYENFHIHALIQLAFYLGFGMEQQL